MPCLVTTQWTIGDYAEPAQASIAEQKQFHEMTFTGELTDVHGTVKSVSVHVKFDPPLQPASTPIEKDWPGW